MISLRKYAHDLMRDEREGRLAAVAGALLFLISLAYGFVVRLHTLFYRARVLKIHDAGIPVISVGNITLGGTGKTPFTIMLARRLAAKGLKTAVLIRGYGEDEWKLLEERLSKEGVKVFVGRDRVKHAITARKGGFDTVILDDGFQHRRLDRDLDIVLLDAVSPLGNRHLFPRGILREPASGLKRADLLVFTKVDMAGESINAAESEIIKIAPGKKAMKAFHAPKSLMAVNSDSAHDLSLIENKNVCLISAICDPSYFRHTVEKAGARVALEFIFPDHHDYAEGELDLVVSECREKRVGFIITTEKDAVKIKGKGFLKYCAAGVYALRIDLELLEGEKELNAELDRLRMRAGNKGA